LKNSIIETLANLEGSVGESSLPGFILPPPGSESLTLIDPEVLVHIIAQTKLEDEHHVRLQ
jgi:hypothetical protein